MAVTILDSVDEVHHGLTKVRTSRKRVKALPPLVSIRHWLPLYRDHHRLERFLSSLLGFDATGPDSVKEIRGSAIAWDGLPTDEKREFVETLPGELLVNFVKTSLDELAEARKGLVEDIIEDQRPPTPECDKQMEALHSTPEMQFFQWVWVPCWVFYGQYATRLLHRARCGQSDSIHALVDLLRIDKSIVHDPFIADVIHRASQDPASGTFRRIHKAFAARAPEIDKTKVKKRLGAFAIQMSHSMKQPLDEGDIRELYDILARLKTGHPDADIPPASDTFSKAMRRERSRIRLFPNPDKNR